MKLVGAVASAVSSALVPMLAAAGAALVLGACASCQSTVREVAVPGIAAGSFDGVEADQGAHRLYLADSAKQGVDVVDISSATPRFLGTIDVGGVPKGLAVAADAHRLYAGIDGGGLAAIDTGTGQMVKSLSLGSPAADLVDYSAQRQRVYVSTGSAGEVVMVDATTMEVSGRLYSNGPIQQPRYDPADGMVYATSPQIYSILRFNPADKQLTRTYLLDGCHVGGLAINPARQLALTTCGGASVAVVNLKTGAYDVTRVVQGGDLVSYDARADRFVVASPHDRGDSTLSVFYGDGRFLGSVAMSPQAHAAAFDDAHGLVYTIGAAGLMSLTPGACEPPPDWVTFAGRGSLFVVPMLAFALFLIWYARRPRAPAGPKWDELRKEDLVAERERMRELEDSIYGPLVE